MLILPWTNRRDGQYDMRRVHSFTRALGVGVTETFIDLTPTLLAVRGWEIKSPTLVPEGLEYSSRHYKDPKWIAGYMTWKSGTRFYSESGLSCVPDPRPVPLLAGRQPTERVVDLILRGGVARTINMTLWLLLPAPKIDEPSDLIEYSVR